MRYEGLEGGGGRLGWMGIWWMDVYLELKL